MATIRKTCTCRWCISSFGMHISEVKRHRTTFEDGSSEMAVSSVDFLVSNTDSFVMGCNKYYISKCIGGNINKGGLWDIVLSELERTCISKVERLPKYGSQMETVFTVPIIGHMQFPPTATDDDNILGSYHGCREESEPCAFHGMKRAAVQKVKRNPAKYLFWEGKYFDTAMVYEYDATRSNSLRALGPLQPPLPTLSSSSKAMVVEFIKGVSYRNRQGSRCHNARLTHSKEGQHTHCTGQGGWTQQGEADYLEINLAYPRYVTHIGIAGEYPGLKQFPTRRIVGKRRLRTFRASEEYEQLMLERQHGGIKASKFAPYVKIVGGSGTAADLGSVSSYEVHYRHHVSNKWTLLAVTDASAGDPLQEAVLDLRPYFNQRDGLFTQTLRIRPLGHHLRPVLRAAVYGLDMKASVVSQSTVQRYRSICEQDEVDHSSSTGSGSDTDGEQDAVADRDVTATIQYVLAGAHSGGAVKVAKDGRSTYHNSRSDYSYDYGRNPKAVKNRAWQSTIKETLRQKPWKDRFCGPNCDFCWPA